MGFNLWAVGRIKSAYCKVEKNVLNVKYLKELPSIESSKYSVCLPIYYLVS